jgi:hypothetical protein
MIAAAKALVLAFVAVTGVGATGVATGAIDIPLQKAIDIHEDHLGENSTMPGQSQKGQQNALDHLLSNQEKWLASHNMTHVPDDDLNETDDAELED